MTPPLVPKVRIPPNDRLLLAICFVTPLALYVWTAAPGITLVDSGELALAGATLGMAHPPGFPVYVMLGHLFAWLPVGGDVARRLNLFSALCAATAAALLFLLCRRLLDLESSGNSNAEDRPDPKKARGKQRRADPAPAPVPLLPMDNSLCSAAAALSFGFSLSLWSWAVVTEVYALNIMLLAAMFLACAHHRWRTAALVAGLALGVHHATVVMALPAAAWLVWSSPRRPNLRTLAAMGAAGFAGLLAYVYLPVRAAMDPVFNWGDPRTIETFWWQISAKQYRIHLFEAPMDVLFSRAGYFAQLAWRQFTPAGFALAALGAASVVRWRNRRVFWFLALLAALNAGFAVNYDIAEDIEGYYLPAFLAGAICLAFGARTLLGWAKTVEHRSWTLAALAVITLAPAVVHYSVNNRRHDRIAHWYVENTLNSARPGALIVTSDWQFYSPWLYRRYVEGLRPDVTVIDTLMMRRSWYLRFLESQYPELLRDAAQEAEAYREQLNLFEHDQSYDPRRIDTAFVALVEKMARVKMAAGAPVYFTLKLERAFLGSERITPTGLLYQFAAGAPRVQLNLAGLRDGSVTLDAVGRGVASVYDSMIRYRAAFEKERAGRP